MELYQIKVLVRLIQALFAFISMALAAATIANYNSVGSSSSAHNFALFTALSALILAPLLAFAPRLHNRHGVKAAAILVEWRVETALTVVWSIFWLSAFFAVAAKFFNDSCSDLKGLETTCRVSKALTAFCFFGMVLWLATLYMILKPILRGETPREIITSPVQKNATFAPISATTPAAMPFPEVDVPLSSVAYGGPGIIDSSGQPVDIVPVPFPEPTYDPEMDLGSPVGPNKYTTASMYSDPITNRYEGSSVVKVRGMSLQSSRPTTPDSQLTSGSMYPGSTDAIYPASSRFSIGAESRKVGSVYPVSVEAMYAGSSRAASGVLHMDASSIAS